MRQVVAQVLLLGLALGGNYAGHVAKTVRDVLVPEDPCGNVTVDIASWDRTSDPLEINVSLDGTPIIRAKIAVDEINPSSYRFKWTPGPHEIRVETPHVRAKLTERVEIRDRQFITIVYGYAAHPGKLFLTVFNEPPVWW